MNAANHNRPLVVDLDNTFILTDTLLEGVCHAAGHDPKALLQAIPHVFSDRLAFKNALEAQSTVGASLYPVDEDVLACINDARAQGREVWLATASPRAVADAVAAAHPVFDSVLASDAGTNLKGAAKADALIARFGHKGFDYIGDSQSDTAIWQHAHTAIVSGSATSKVRRMAQACNDNCVCLPAHQPTAQNWLAVLRVKQWVKNLLVFVPMILAHLFTWQAFWESAIAFLSISFCASAIYVLNDSLDVHSDRQHSRKKNRPFAAGRISLGVAPVAFLLPLGLATGLAFFLPHQFAACLLLYFLGTVLYSFALKKLLLIDVITLSLLYILRILAGCAALAIAVSNWLLAFSAFIFLGLALIKRIAAFSIDVQDGKLPGRAYLVSDKQVLEVMATSCGFAAFVICTLYIDSLQSTQLYANTEYLWLICPVLIYWYGKILLLANRGDIDDDPVSYTIHDKSSYISLSIILFLLFMAL